MSFVFEKKIYPDFALVDFRIGAPKKTESRIVKTIKIHNKKRLCPCPSLTPSRGKSFRRPKAGCVKEFPCFEIPTPRVALRKY